MTKEKDSRILSEDEMTQLVTYLIDVEKKGKKRMKRVRRKSGIGKVDPKIPEPNLEMGNPKLSRNLGLVAYYPVSWAYLAAFFELGIVAWILSLLGAVLSLLYVVDTWTVYEAKPIWVYDKTKAGPITAKLANSGHLFVWVLLSLIPFIVQSYTLFETLTSILSIMDITSFAVVITVASGFYTFMLYKYVQWRRGPLLACPWCSKEHKNPEPLELHCKIEHLIVPKNYVIKHEKREEGKQVNHITRGLLIVGTWDLGLEVILYLEFGDVFKFLGLLAFDFILIVVSGNVRNWIQVNEKRIKKKGGLTELQESVRDRTSRVVNYRSVFTIFYISFLLLTFQEAASLIVLLSTSAVAFIAMVRAHSKAEELEGGLKKYWREYGTVRKCLPFALLGACLNILIGVTVWLASQNLFLTIFLGLAPEHGVEFFWGRYLVYNAD
jgi:hypothetical protein